MQAGAGPPQPAPAAAQPVAPPPAALQPPAAELAAKYDRQSGLTSLVVIPVVTRACYLGGLSTAGIAQLVLFWLSVVLTLAAWPTLHPASYQRHRTRGVAALRVFVFSLPVFHSAAWVDSLVPGPSGILPVDVFLMLLASKTGLLWRVAVGATLPFRVHVAVQTAACAILCLRAAGPFCHSQLFTSAVWQAHAQRLHWVMAAAAAPLEPHAAVANMLVAGTPLGNCRVMLYFCYSALGWLLPTVVLVPAQPAPGEGMLERSLRSLKPAAGRQQRGGGGGAQPSSLTAVLLRWWMVLSVLWAACWAIELFL